MCKKEYFKNYDIKMFQHIREIDRYICTVFFSHNKKFNKDKLSINRERYKFKNGKSKIEDFEK